jgi:mannose-6-phosphate isomerase-like protein (cupin superfamily)
MGEYTVKRIDEMEAVYLGAFKRARAELGVESFGLQVIDLPPDFENYPEHDHAEDGQEEVFMAIKGGGEIEIDGERFPLDPDHMARVASGTKRKVWPGSEGMRMVIVGGVPGGVYQAPDVSKLGEPDPMQS